MRTRHHRLTKQDKANIVTLAGHALSGILADHEHHARFGNLTCPQSSCEWAARYGFETYMRLLQKFEDAKTQPITFPKHVKAYG